MEIIVNPQREQWRALTRRPVRDATELFETVRPILQAVQRGGDAALRQFSLRFDHCELTEIRLSAAERAAAAEKLSPALRAAICTACDNITRFHAAQRVPAVRVQTAPGVYCEQRTLPIERVGLYVPGGVAPLFSTVLMLGVPARLAGCRNVTLCTPPGQGGQVNPAIVYAAEVCGISRICRVGGAQAIAALAYGTESVPKADKIFGPGNSYVTAAKQLAALGGTAIDMPAGPSEVLVYADASSRADFVAADLLSQAEHGPDSQVILVTTERNVLTAVTEELEEQLMRLPRREIAQQTLSHSRALLFERAQDAEDFINAYAPEHLVLAVQDARAAAERTTQAGSVFLGNYSCESAGDYASGTNHTLPTLGCARAYSALCTESFMRRMTLQEITPRGIASIGRCVELMAEAEQMEAHKNAMSLRADAAARVRSCMTPEQLQDEQRQDMLSLVRPCIRNLKPYSSARDEYCDRRAHVFLDANESPYNAPYNRYPDPLQRGLKAKLAAVKGVPAESIFLGNGSDEAIDLICRIFCEPGRDNVLAPEPTYGMYAVCAHINGVEYRSVPLGEGFSFSASALLAGADACTRVIFLCSPNNPTGNLLPREETEKVLRGFGGIVVVDEAYIDFAPWASWLPDLAKYPRLIVLSTFSKARAGAGIRLGMAFAHPQLITFFNRVKYPYNINSLTQEYASAALDDNRTEARVRSTIEQRRLLAEQLAQLHLCRQVYPSDANFLLVRTVDAQGIYDALVSRSIIVRNRSQAALCAGCLRITVGTPGENEELLAALREIDRVNYRVHSG